MCGCACATDVRPRAWSPSSAMAEPEVSLDKALERLESIADKLEDPGLDLDEAVRIYEEGLRLYAECAKRLDAADLRITQLADALAKQARERGAGYGSGSLRRNGSKFFMNFFGREPWRG